jgi:signal transduction histidine kinase
VLDTPAEEDFDALARLAAHICSTPFAMVGLVDADRHWLKAQIGGELTEANLTRSFGAYTILSRDVTEVPDATADPRFADHPMVTGPSRVRFYAGAPVVLDGGHAVGTVCVADREPRQLTDGQRQALRSVARHAAVLLELRRFAGRADEVAEQQRRLDRMKDSVLNAANHELRTPLSSIHGYLELLINDDIDPDTTQRFLAVMQRNSQRLLRLVDDLILMARLSHGSDLHVAAIDLAELTHQVTLASRPLAEAKQLTLTHQTHDSRLILGDAKLVSQALHHLIFNAVKFTNPGGRITVTTDNHADEPTVIITDTGVGIPTADLPHLFDRFYRSTHAETRADQGTGLGLSIVKAIIDAHHGSMHIDSEPSIGTTVRIILPAGDP